MRDTFSGSLAKAGLILDFIGDYEAVVVSEEGSRSISELLGRLSISVGAAILTTVTSDILLTLILLVAKNLPKHPVILLIFFGGVVVIYTTYKIADLSNQVKDIIWKKEK